jgi:hypothetical protein
MPKTPLAYRLRVFRIFIVDKVIHNPCGNCGQNLRKLPQPEKFSPQAGYKYFLHNLWINKNKSPEYSGKAYTARVSTCG